MNFESSSMDVRRRARRNTLSDLLDRSAARYPDKRALAFGGEDLTYGQFNRRVTQTCHMLIEAGLSANYKRRC